MAKPTKKILVVEDEPLLLRVTIDKLKLEGFKTLEARQGKDGLAAALKRHPDLILLDLLMPRMDGFAMLKELRNDRWGKKVPVLILTNLSDPAKAEEAKTYGANGYLIKSDWKLSQVVDKIKEILKQVQN